MSVILLILAVVSVWFWMHWRVSDGLQMQPRSNSVPQRKRLAAVHPPSDSGTSTGNPPKLWDSVGCNSRYPILQCEAIKRKVPTLDLTASLADFENSVYLNSTAHNSCSLVGSSGNLRNHAYGKLIDNNSIVIRINNPPVKGYEEFVGHRPAEIMFINNQLFGKRCLVPINHSTLYVCAASRGLIQQVKTARLCKAQKKAKIYGISKYLGQISDNLLAEYAQRYNLSRGISGENYIRPTSGFKSLLFSMLVCRHVHMFGFGMQGADRFHYYSKDTVYSPKHHAVDLETKILEDIDRGTFDSDLVDLKDTVFGKVTVHH